MSTLNRGALYTQPQDASRDESLSLFKGGHLLLAAFFGGCVLVAMLGAVNWLQIGKPRHLWATLAAGLLGIPLLSLVTDAVILSPSLAVTLGVTNAVAGFLLAGAILVEQRRWLANAESMEDGCLMMIAGFIATLVYVQLVVPVVMNALKPIITSVMPYQAFSGHGISLSYPSGWRTITDFASEPFCQEVECIWIGDDGPAIQMQVQRVSPGAKSILAESMASSAREIVPKQLPGAREVSYKSITLLGRNAYEIEFDAPSNGFLVVYIQDGFDVLVLSATVAPRTLDQHRDTIDSVLNSIRFVEE